MSEMTDTDNIKRLYLKLLLRRYANHLREDIEALVGAPITSMEINFDKQTADLFERDTYKQTTVLFFDI